MKKTGNYQLNLWEKSDRIQMEDFNADNMKLDAALAAMQEEIEAARAANPYVKLLDYTSMSNTQQISLDMRGIDLTKYHKLELYVAGLASTTGLVVLRVNGLTTGYYSSTHKTGTGEYLARGGLSAEAQRQGPLVFTILLENSIVGGVASGFVMDAAVSAVFTFPDHMLPLSPSEVTSLNISMYVTDYTLLAGCKVSVYGLKR